MEYVPVEPGLEVSGQGIHAVLEAFNAFSLLASQIMLKEGIGEESPDGTIRADPEGWYSFDGYMRAYRSVAAQLGDQVIFQVGMAMPKHAKFPPMVKDVPSAMEMMDIAYHMNHRKGGKLMFDPATGTLIEGIGHYRCERVQGKNMIVAVCANPYPCHFDRGLYTTCARRFDPTAVVVHDDSKPCRHKGADSCTYRISWK